MPAESSHHAHAKPPLVDISASLRQTRPPKAFLLCRDDFSIQFVSDLLQVILQLPEQRASGARRDIFSLLGSSGVLDPVSVNMMLEPIRSWGLQSMSCELQTESGLHPITMRVRPASDGQWMLSFEDIHADHERRAELLALTLTDPLVGINNRRCFQQTVQSSLADNIPGTILMIDLDRFKEVNNTHGHPTGDQLLRKAGERMRAMAGDENLLSRLGGNEFAMWCYTIELDSMKALAARIVERLRQAFLIDGQLVYISASIGVAIATEAGTTYERMMRCADLALHSVKKQGGGGYRTFEPSIEAADLSRRKQQLRLRKALSTGQFTPRYRARVDVETGETLGFSAEAAWHDPERGVLDSHQLADMAGDAGLEAAIARWLLRTACIDALDFADRAPVSVVIGKSQFSGQLALLDSVRQALEASGLPAHQLELEIEEDALGPDGEQVQKTLDDVHSLGVRICMLNAGSGHAPLSVLVTLPFSAIRMGAAFAVPQNKKQQALLNAVAALGHSLGVPVTVDGVATGTQMQHLRESGAFAVRGCTLKESRPATSLVSLAEPCAPDGAH